MSIIHAEPTKNFFINMITRDIDLNDCIYDLIDNCLDGAASEVTRLKKDIDDLSGYYANLKITKDKFTISDNCGGISIEQAENYAFHFGKKTDKSKTKTKSIGLYGIGMKRAIFKIGKLISISSETYNESFSVDIDVNTWAAEEKWEFTLNKKNCDGEIGTTIEITDISKDIIGSFTDNSFINGLIGGISKYYAIFIDKGFEIKVNGNHVKPYSYQFEVSDEITPANFKYKDDSTGVLVQVIAGLAAAPPDDSSADVKQRNPENWGWYIVCNDRVVIAADKTTKTIWGRDFSVWHPSYNGFMGMVKFSSENSSDLPWTTTKREIDQSSSLYMRALIKMKEATQPILIYTRDRIHNRDNAVKLESKAVSTPLSNLPTRQYTKMPDIRLQAPVKTTTRIQYDKTRELVEKVAISLGRKNMTNKDVGIKTFDYYVENEIEE